MTHNPSYGLADFQPVSWLNAHRVVKKNSGGLAVGVGQPAAQSFPRANGAGVQPIHITLPQELNGDFPPRGPGVCRNNPRIHHLTGLGVQVRFDHAGE